MQRPKSRGIVTLFLGIHRALLKCAPGRFDIQRRSAWDYARFRVTEVATPRDLIGLSVVYAVGRCYAAALVGGVGRQVIRGWVLCFNAVGPDGQIVRKAPCKPRRLNYEQRQSLGRWLKAGRSRRMKV